MRPRNPSSDPGPRVSVVMANRDGARFLADAIRSVLCQTERDLELLVVDDASTDESRAILAGFAASDPRVVPIEAPSPLGPAGARNLALERASGAWIAIVDSDDLLHPERLTRLLDRADGADLVADNLLVFHPQGGPAPSRLLGGALAAAPSTIGIEAWIDANRLDGRTAALGYLKPLIRRTTLTRLAIAYDPSLVIAEDYDLVLRLLAGGAVFRLLPELTYFYRKHSGSISHRLSRATLSPMIDAHDRFEAALPAHAASTLRHALGLRRRSLVDALRFEDLVAALRTRDRRAVASILRTHPQTAFGLRRVLAARIARAARALRRRPPAVDPRPVAAIIAKQRIPGAVNGSSAYLLDICARLAQQGYALDLVCPAPGTFGRWPALKLRPEMRCFRTVRFRGGIRLGRLVIGTDPALAARAVLTVLDRLALRLGLGRAHRIAPAPYAVALPWTDEDLLFVARHARGAALVVADYAFQTPAIPYALNPRARSIVVMHDIFSNMSQAGAVVSIARADELALLSRADAVIAIQRDEAASIRDELGGRPVVVLPMSTACVDRPQPGDTPSLLFVGSNTAPNAQGLTWFLDRVWPTVLAAEPLTRLVVAGSVAAAIQGRHKRVELLGRVDALAPLYRDAACVISPLLTGTGLKIKLVEALGHGKAMVATSVTLQGVEGPIGDAVMRADAPDAFADAVIAVLRDRDLRLRLGERALGAARATFSAAAGMQALEAALRPKPAAAARPTARLGPAHPLVEGIAT